MFASSHSRVVRSRVEGEFLAVSSPIFALIAAGLEHSVANMHLIPLGILLAPGAPAVATAPDGRGFLSNLVSVTLGNIAGCSILVAAVHPMIYRRGLERGSWKS